MSNKRIRKFIKKRKKNSGFTLTELLAGLFMSIFVSGALGFGLMQIMQATAREQAKSNARNEATRAVEFISDELRRASAIEPNAASATTYTASAGETVVLALDIPGVSDRIVYYLENSSGNWQGPQVLYRWGPPLDASGNYTNATNTAAWGNEALIDGIDDTAVANPSSICTAGDTLTPASPNGFYACVNATNTSAQIFLTGGIDTDAVAGNDDTYTAQTRTVARARDVSVSNAMAAPNTPFLMKSLIADYVASPPDDLWTMRMDFDNNPYDSSKTNEAPTWIHQTGRNAQPIDLTDNDLTIHSIPVGQDNANSRGNPGADEYTPLSDILDTGYTVSYTMKFKETVTGRNDDADFWKSFNGDDSDSNHNNPNVDPSGKVIVLKNNSVLDPNVATIDTASSVASAPLYPGFDHDNDPNTPNSPSLGEFLVSKKLAQDNGDGTFTIKNLKSDERIIAFEVGRDDNGFGTYDMDGNTKPDKGFDLQDNVLVMRHDSFKKNHSTSN